MTARKKNRQRRRFGTIDQPSPGGRIRIRYRVNSELHVEWALNLEDAQRRLSAIETDLYRDSWQPPNQQNKTVEDVSEEWVTSKKQTHSTIARDRTVLNRWWLPAFGQRPISTIGRTDVQKVLNVMTASGLSPKTVRTNFWVIRAVLYFALDEHYIARIPVKRVVLPDPTPVQHARASFDTFLALIDALPPRFVFLALLFGICGLRWSEAIALRVGDVDADNNVLYVRRTLVEVGGVIHEGPGKTKGSIGRVSMPDAVVHAYRQHLLVTGLRNQEDLLFTAPRGGPLRATNFRRRIWAPAVEKAGATGYTVRELRQIAGALNREAGATEHEVSVRLRHTHQATTSDVYGGVTAERHAAVDQAITARFLAHKVKRESADTQSGTA